MKRDWLLSIAVGLLTLIVTLVLLRWFAPGLIGAPVDMQIARIEEKLPPYFEVVFPSARTDTSSFLLPDPRTRVRSRPLLFEEAVAGPHDLLGFRNSSVPRIAEVVVIGDSQTYGNNSVLTNNWPSRMARELNLAVKDVYSMAVGGWGAAQYLYMVDKAYVFHPRVLVVAFYSGNDPLDSFHMAYGLEEWAFLRPNSSIEADDAPRVSFPAPKDQWWKVEFADGVSTVFTPTLRKASNSGHPVVQAGWDVMINAGLLINRQARAAGTQAIFTVIPTKESVYAAKVTAEGLNSPEDYRQLVKSEAAYIRRMQQVISAEEGAVFVDLLPELQAAAMDNTALYPEDINGHPVAAGYAVIGDAVAEAVSGFLSPAPEGFLLIHGGEDKYTPVLARSGGLWFFSTNEVIAGNGWRDVEPTLVQPRDVAGVPRLGVINEVDPVRFGPDSDR